MTPYPLHRSETSTKVLITLFLVFMVGAFAVAFLNVYDKVGRVPNGIIERYGPETTQSSAEGIYQDGGEAAPAVARVNTFSALIDITHPHIFEMPLVILVLCHFLMRTRLANWAKVITYILSFGGAGGMLATPWLVRYVSVRLAPLLVVSAVALGVAVVVLVAVPLWDMWGARIERSSSLRLNAHPLLEQPPTGRAAR